MTDWNKVTAFWDLSGAPPCARCGGALYLEQFDGKDGVVKCRSCGHAFRVIARPDNNPDGITLDRRGPRE